MQMQYCNWYVNLTVNIAKMGEVGEVSLICFFEDFLLFKKKYVAVVDLNWPLDTKKLKDATILNLYYATNSYRFRRGISNTKTTKCEGFFLSHQFFWGFVPWLRWNQNKASLHFLRPTFVLFLCAPTLVGECAKLTSHIPNLL